MTDLRRQRWRRDLADLLFYRNGQPEHSKFWANIGCGIVAWWMVTMPERVWQDYIASLVIASMLILPDLARKVIHARSGTTTTETETETSKVVKVEKRKK
jgi:hypothetical protein